MRSRFLQFIVTYSFYVLFFVVQKPVFMACYPDWYGIYPPAEWIRVIGHGLPLDFSLAGYLTLIPGLLLTISAWTAGKWLDRIRQVYFGVTGILLALIFVCDLALYGYWGFRLDTTPLFYFLSSPADAMASVSRWTVAGGILAIIVLAAVIAWIPERLCRTRLLQTHPVYHRLWTSLPMLLLTALLIIPIRGGLTVSTMNLGRVFYSADQRLNHAAINPCFSLMDSFSRQSDFGSQYRFMNDTEATRIFQNMQDAPANDSVPMLFNTRRPNLILVILESFSTHLMESMGGTPGVAVNLDRYAAEGISFRNFYANSFRTDRGLVSILSGYPAQPTTSIMKYTRKTQHLPSISGSLKQAGYDLQYYYGGDANFTNMRSYLVSVGFDKIVCDQDFPLSERTGKWGAHDEVVFERLAQDLKKNPEQPFFKVLQTSSSHEPFEVPYRKLKHPKLNAFAYADSCAGVFVEQLRQSPLWENTVVIFTADHLGAYPDDMTDLKPERYHIPLILIGGAVSGSCNIDTYGSQTDLAATLLCQLGLPYEEFTFSHNILNPESPHFAFCTFPNAFGLFDGQQTVFYDCEADRIVTDDGPAPGIYVTRGKAYLQKLYDDLADR